MISIFFGEVECTKKAQLGDDSQLGLMVIVTDLFAPQTNGLRSLLLTDCIVQKIDSSAACRSALYIDLPGHLLSKLPLDECPAPDQWYTCAQSPLSVKRSDYRHIDFALTHDDKTSLLTLERLFYSI